MQFTCCIKCSFTVIYCNKASNRIVSKTKGFSVFFWIILSHEVSRHFPTHTSAYANFENLLHIRCTPADIPLHYKLLCISMISEFVHKMKDFVSFETRSPSVDALFECTNTTSWIFTCLNYLVSTSKQILLSHDMKENN